MNKLTLFLLVLFIANGWHLHAQEELVYFGQTQLSNGKAITELAYENLGGSPYLTREFTKGKIFTPETVFTQVPLRYDIYKDQMQFKTPEGEVQVLSTTAIKKIELNNINFVYIPYTDAQKVREGYFRLVSGGKAKLYARMHVELNEALPPAPYEETKPYRFE